MRGNGETGDCGPSVEAKDYIGFKIKILDALSVVNVRRVRLPPSGLPKIFILKPIE
jgi:hypothetical protein